MRRLAFATLAALSLAACSLPTMRDESLPPAPEMVDLENPPTGTPIRVRKGGEVKLVLDAVPSTGFQWQGPPTVTPTLSPIGQRIFVPKTADSRNVGAGGFNIFRYRAEQPGKVTIHFEYRRVWETVPPAKTLDFVVTVE
jgi:predicted secreted protein